MNFEWDPAKSETNLRDRGVGFAFASRVFQGAVLEEIDNRRNYGETRVKALGQIDGGLFVVIYTDRPSARRILRPAGEQEGAAAMAFVKMSADKAWAEGATDVDHDKLTATTEEDVRRYMIEDGEDPDVEPAFRLVSPAKIRAKLDMTQVAFAEALAVPVKTLRNWEQRARLDPATQSLMRIVAADPVRAFKAVHGKKWGFVTKKRDSVSEGIVKRGDSTSGPLSKGRKEDAARRK